MATVPPDRGLFLPETWRLHPDICAFTSEAFYQGRLAAVSDLDRQLLRGAERLHGSGVRLLELDHRGNQNESAEEAEAVRELVADLLESSTWTDKHFPRDVATLTRFGL